MLFMLIKCSAAAAADAAAAVASASSSYGHLAIQTQFRHNFFCDIILINYNLSYHDKVEDICTIFYCCIVVAAAAAAVAAERFRR